MAESRSMKASSRPCRYDRVAQSVDPASSYVAALFAKGGRRDIEEDRRGGDRDVMARRTATRARIAGEVADLWFHCLVLLARHVWGLPTCWRIGAARRGFRHREKASARPATD